MLKLQNFAKKETLARKYSFAEKSGEFESNFYGHLGSRDSWVWHCQTQESMAHLREDSLRPSTPRY